MDKEALLIIDMSNDFVADQGSLSAGKAAQTIVPYIMATAKRFLEKKHPVIFCMDAHDEKDSHFELWPPHNIKGTWGQAIYGELGSWYEAHKTDENVIYLPKPEYDAFFQTDLEDILKQMAVDCVHLTGVCTDICDFLTAYGAYSRGYKTVVHRQGTATFTEQHELFLNHMKAIFKTVIV
ncbi:isochorismatase [Pullulanibacillus camelliae]|uniref:Isochorismatase n=1 Tax=Pullulanibacillus camelliae TaxID=1707096 RepID=A0A8J2YGB6_9BACL|nr:isochorismatase [Pullulanibacillus camelliae]